MKPSDRLRKSIHDSGLTQRDFAKSVGLSLSGLSTILRGKSPVSRTLALAVEAVYRCRADWILEGDGFQWRDNAAQRAHVRGFKPIVHISRTYAGIYNINIYISSSK